MNIKQIAIATVSLLAGTVAMASGSSGDVWAKFHDVSSHVAPERSRAEVIADLEIYQRSGLAELDRADEPNIYSAEYRAAQVRYQTMRSSPEFSARVHEIARERGEAVAAASSSIVLG